MPSPISSKYGRMLAREILRRKPTPGTMPADMKIIRQVIEAKFADKKFLEGLINDVVARQRISLKVG